MLWDISHRTVMPLRSLREHMVFPEFIPHVNCGIRIAICWLASLTYKVRASPLRTTVFELTLFCIHL